MRKIWLTMATMAMAVSLTACGGSKSQTGTETESSAAAEITAAGTAAETQEASSDAAEAGDEKVADKDTMVIGCYGATQSMFPANDSKLPGAQIHVNLYDTLLTMDKDGEVQPFWQRNGNR